MSGAEALKNARYHAERGELEQALTYLRAVSRRDQRFAEASDLRGALLDRRGSFEEALVAYREALDADPTHAPSLRALSRHLLRRGRHEEALALLEGFAQAGGDRKVFSRQEMETRFIAGDIGGATRLAKASLAEDPTDDTARRLLARVELSKGLTEQALAIATHAPDESPEAHWLLGKIYVIRGDLQRACLHFDSALERREDFPEARNEAGACALEFGDLDSAEEHFLKALEHAPWLDEALLNLAQVYALRRRGDEALSICLELTARSPHLAHVHLVLASLYLDTTRVSLSAYPNRSGARRRIQLAREALLEAVERSADKKGPIANAARALLALKQFQNQ